MKINAQFERQYSSIEAPFGRTQQASPTALLGLTSDQQSESNFSSHCDIISRFSLM